MKRLFLPVALVACLVSCSPSSSTDSEHDKSTAYFVTQLGTDTLAIERLIKTENGFEAYVLLRSPSSSLTTYQLKQDTNGGVAELSAYKHSAEEPFNISDSNLTYKIKQVGDSLSVETEARNPENPPLVFNVKNEPGTLPFIDMVHWPFELAFQQAIKNPSDSIYQKLLSGRRISNFIIHKERNDSLTLRHPSRGVMGVSIDRNGNLQKLDAALTTRKLVVTRVGEMDFESLVKDFAQRDKKSSPFGELSGAIAEDFSFNGVDFSVSYGSPQKRGRTIFGGIVPWGKLWRTGANRATHFRTSANLTIGQLKVPAGEYTFFTIPEPDGGTLIINKQTGQNGQSYDPARDLGRVPMKIGQQSEVTEPFTIKVVESGKGGQIHLIWDKTVLSIEFEIE